MVPLLLFPRLVSGLVAMEAAPPAVPALQSKGDLTWTSGSSGETSLSPGNLILQPIETVKPLSIAGLNLKGNVQVKCRR